ncbi:hypothetical protein [Clostridium botulinum]|uniref:hypothetical protein n=1 Tax=Clostridium botulinum TaxID=1491 RepID=UPI0007733733|nr:hypothetical protein [Clostridium botulinum]MBY6811897.1 hypothetical protein [Clostridium botulinum]MBY6825379.1 hypothetical protein [Clostridium botulinum]MBY6835728.1 hypothetical protein [Clostridium botulinum]MBY6974413.1 hypothetical protein [Clostridium botulinum]MCS6105471.1 hypothetical protein [Clostridium botulinum]
MKNEFEKKAIILNGLKLHSNKMCKINIVIRKKNTTIIKGNVYNENHDPSIGAVVQVKEINCGTGDFRILGYCFTNYKGEYVFSLQPVCKTRYEILIYSPLVKS